MDKSEFVNQVKKLSTNINHLSSVINNEEQTKQSLIIPFFATLGYDVFNPLEFIPEFTADVSSIKKGERVDYAIKIDNQVVMLIEAKSLDEDLDKHTSQINRYFNVVDAKFSIITNGREFRFYSDLNKENIMDDIPFLTIDLSNIKDNQINELFKFERDNFNVENITSIASGLKYVGQIKAFLLKQIEVPNDDFVRLVLDEIGYDGLKRQTIIDEFRPMVSQAIRSFISENVNDRLSNALNSTSIDPEDAISVSSNSAAPEKVASQIITTDAELEVFTIAKLILSRSFILDRIFYRDNATYFNILIDDNNRKWVLRAYFNTSRSWIVLNDEANTIIDFKEPVEIYKYADEIVKLAERFIS